jgi:hypothetical protein
MGVKVLHVHYQQGGAPTLEDRPERQLLKTKGAPHPCEHSVPPGILAYIALSNLAPEARRGRRVNFPETLRRGMRSALGERLVAGLAGHALGLVEPAGVEIVSGNAEAPTISCASK